MAMISKEIVQSRVWLYPDTPPAPNLNYKLTYPITVYDAVHKTVDDDSETLTSELDRIHTSIKSKQPILPGKPADNLVTYGGYAGGVGSIQISQKIPYDAASQSTDRIPTEKAVGELLRKFGLLTYDGEATGDTSVRILYTSIVGRPEVYNELGTDDEGVVSQAAITQIIQEIRNDIIHIWDDFDSSTTATLMRDHMNDTNNPHGLTARSVGAADIVDFEEHVNNVYNPHRVTKDQVGLGNVDNTSDAEKPISNSVRVALNAVNQSIADLTGMVGGLRYVVDMEYIQDEGRLDITFNDDSVMGVSIITDGLIDEIKADTDTGLLVVTELGGRRQEVDIYEIVKYTGITTRNIVFDISKENRTIAANIRPNSISSEDIALGGILGTNIANKTITGDNVADGGLVTANYADWSVTGLKIANRTISDAKIVKHGLTGESLFTSDTEGVLAVTIPNSDAVWAKVSSTMVADGGISTENLADEAVTTEKIATHTITSDNVAIGGIIGESMADNSIEGSKLKADSVVTKNVRLDTPDMDAEDNVLVNAEWVRYNMNHNSVTSNVIAPRAVQPRHLFSSEIKDRVLIVTSVEGDAQWGQIQANMIGENAVIEGNIADNAVTAEKLGDRSVTSRALDSYAVETQNIAEGAVTPDKIYTSEEITNQVLAVGPGGGHPAYTKITAEMMALDSVTTDAIADGSITPSKFAEPTLDNTVLLFDLEHHSPDWGKVDTKYIANYAVTGEKLFTSPRPNTVLAVLTENTPPVYTKVTSAMLEDITFDTDNLAAGSVKRIHLADDIIDATKLADRTVETRHIVDESITADKLFQPTDSDLVLGVSRDDTKPTWTKISSGMIEDLAITPEKMFRSERPYVLLGAVNVGDAPTYMKLTQDFIYDHTIGSSKLKADLKLYGYPTLDKHPNITANDYSIATTAWVRNFVDMTLEYFRGSFGELADNSIELSKLKTSDTANRVLAVLEENGVPVYTTVNTEMIDNDSITTNKLARNLNLLGSPTLDVRPSLMSSDRNGGGNLIPDCQWVVDRINESLHDFHRRLKETLCCMKTPDPEIMTGYQPIMIDDIKDEAVLDILNGEMEPEAFRPIVTNDFIIERISDDRLEGIVDGTIEPDDSHFLDLPEYRVGYMDENTIAGIVNGDIEYEDYHDGGVRMIIRTSAPAGCCGCCNGTNYTTGTDPTVWFCCCNTTLYGHNRRYITPIPDPLVTKLADNRAIPEPVTEPIELAGIRVSSITTERLQSMMTNTADPKPIPVASTFINDNEFGPIEITRIEGLIRGIITPNPSTAIEVTEGINVEEDPTMDYRYICPINTTIIEKICNDTAEPQHRQPLYDNDGHEITVITDYWLDQMIKSPTAVTEYSSNFQVHEYQYAPIDVDRIEGLIRGTIEPLPTGVDDISEFRYIPEDRKLTENSVITEFIQRRAVTGDKLFTSSNDNTIMAVIEANSDPIYTKITRPMMVDHLITPDLMYTSAEPNKVLGVINAGDDPVYLSVSGAMIEDYAISNKHLQDSSITGDKIADSSIGAGKLAHEAMIETVHIIDDAVTSRKIMDGSIVEEKIGDLQVTTSKIADGAVTSEKLNPDIKLPTGTTIVQSNDYFTKQLRNITVSAALPVGCDNGDIWFQYV